MFNWLRYKIYCLELWAYGMLRNRHILRLGAARDTMTEYNQRRRALWTRGMRAEGYREYGQRFMQGDAEIIDTALIKAGIIDPIKSPTVADVLYAKTCAAK